MGITIPPFLASMTGILIGFLFARLFVKISQKGRFILTPLGTTFFGDPEGPRKQFVGPRKGAIIAVIDVVLISLAISLIEVNTIELIKQNQTFSIPYSLFLLNTIYFIFSKYSKMKPIEIFSISAIYLISLVWGLSITGII